MELTGKVIEVFDAKEKKNFRKREFMMEYQDGAFMRTVLFQCMGGKAELVDDLNVGDQVFVKFNIETRKAEAHDGAPVKLWTNCTCWFINKL